ncbi:MAG: alpha/beta hydrolase [Anaerolineales bacterium]|nr:alpha/beta hydrolase [Chloroflexota bacterium]MBL7163001.1 alpha/beta hydrolase [Anaerolineales bacterium]
MKSQFVTLPDGLRIHTLVAGAEENPPLILLHGYPSNSQLWRRCIPPLADHFRVYAPDLPGYGQSDKPLDVEYDLDYSVHFLLGFYDALGLEQAGLVVHDVGGMLGLGFAARHPERVTRFVVMDTAPYVEWNFILRAALGLARNSFSARFMLTRAGFKWIARRLLVHNPAAITDEVVDLYRDPWVENPDSRRAFSHVIGLPPVHLTEPRQNLRRITAPTLILWAEKDVVFPTRIARQLQTDIAGSELITVPDCGHFLQEEQPELVVEHLLRFLEGE